MNLEDELELEHLLLEDRRCRKCLVTKNLLSDFYKTRKDRGTIHLHLHMSVKNVLRSVFKCVEEIKRVVNGVTILTGKQFTFCFPIRNIGINK